MTNKKKRIKPRQRRNERGLNLLCDSKLEGCWRSNNVHRKTSGMLSQLWSSLGVDCEELQLLKCDAMYRSKWEGRILSKTPSTAEVTKRLWQKNDTRVLMTCGTILTARNRSTGWKRCRNGTLSSTDPPARWHTNLSTEKCTCCTRLLRKFGKLLSC